MKVVRLAWWLIRRGCSETLLEEMEGDLLELFAAGESRGPLHRGCGVVWEAIRMVLGRPSNSLRRRVHRLALIFTGIGVGIAYALLVISWADPLVLTWPAVLVGVVFELAFLCLLLGMGRMDVGHDA